MLLTGTESLMYKIESEDVYEDFTRVKGYLTSLIIIQYIHNLTIIQIT